MCPPGYYQSASALMVNHALEHMNMYMYVSCMNEYMHTWIYIIDACMNINM